MALMVRELSQYKYYYKPTEDKTAIERELLQQKMTNPSKIPYYLTACVKRPGFFYLVYLPRKTVVWEYVTISPNGFKYRDHVFSTLNQLLAWFKVHFRDPRPDMRPKAPQPHVGIGINADYGGNMGATPSRSHQNALFDQARRTPMASMNVSKFQSSVWFRCINQESIHWYVFDVRLVLICVKLQLFHRIVEMDFSCFTKVFKCGLGVIDCNFRTIFPTQTLIQCQSQVEAIRADRTPSLLLWCNHLAILGLPLNACPPPTHTDPTVTMEGAAPPGRDTVPRAMGEDRQVAVRWPPPTAITTEKAQLPPDTEVRHSLPILDITPPGVLMCAVGR